MKDEFAFFREWMDKNPSEWRRRDVNLTAPAGFVDTFGRELIPIYQRFLDAFGALDLMSWCDDPIQPLSYTLFAPEEILQAYTEHVIRWNHPEGEWDFNCFMPFCQHLSSNSYDCFDMRWPVEDDLPVVMFTEAEALPDHDIKVATSFRYWLEKMVKYGNPLA